MRNTVPKDYRFLSLILGATVTLCLLKITSMSSDTFQKNDNLNAEFNTLLEELQRDENPTLTLEQYKRKKLVKKVCNKYGNTKKFLNVKSFIVDPKVLQKVHRWFRD